ncbi:MAG: SDR family oxidoreductase [Longimicrobiales bacterium]
MAERVLIAGCGYVGSRLAELLLDDGVRVWGLKRDPSTLPAGVGPVAGDVTRASTLDGLPSGDEAPDAVVYAVSPPGRTAEAYRTAYVDGLRNVLDAVDAGTASDDEGPPRPRLILVSSTGVYGQSDGQWVDEETPEEPADAMAEAILEGEAVAVERGAPGTVIRLGGIYGPGRTWTVGRVLSGDAPCMGPELYGNRVHRDDAAGAIRHLLTLTDPDPVYNGVDGEGAPLREVYAWVAERAAVPDPCEGVDPEDARSEGRRGTNKRVSNDRLVSSGYDFIYPSFRDGYATLIPEASGG